jgi:hypothetical protein
MGQEQFRPSASTTRGRAGSQFLDEQQQIRIVKAAQDQVCTLS